MVFKSDIQRVRIKMLEQFSYQMHYLIDIERQQIVILVITHIENQRNTNTHYTPDLHDQHAP